jgi:DNA polymerase elongation subunit (family B)
MSITIGGQLSLCMIIERIIDEVNGEVLMANTDGFEFICNRSQQQQVDEIVNWWQNVTGLELEGDSYSKMFVRDVNNYISVTEKGKIKLKGAYEFADFDKIGWHKNQSAMVIAKAVKAHLIDGIDYEEFIKLHQDKYDFMLRTKVPRSSSLVLVNQDGTEEKLQNICRYYICKKGGKLVKFMPALEEGGEVRMLGIDTDWNVKPCNNIKDFKWDLDYEYYFSEAKKLIDAVA